MAFQTGVGARLGIRGTFECKDKDGNVLKIIEMTGGVPLSDLGLTVEEAQSLVDNQSELNNGPNHRQ